MEPRQGKCLCGAVSVSLRLDKPELWACHCSMCRQWASGALFVVHPPEPPVFGGTDHIAVFRSSDWAERAFCKRCGTGLYYRFLPKDSYAISAGLLEEPQDLSRTLDVYVEDRMPWCTLSGASQEMTRDTFLASYEISDNEGTR